MSIIKTQFILEAASLDQIPGSCLLDNKTTAEVLGVSPATLDIWRCTGRYGLPFIKVGRKVRYKAEDIRAFLESRTRLHT